MLRDEINQVLHKLKGDFEASIFINYRQFRASLADIPIENEGKKVRNLLNIAICDMKAYSRMETALNNNGFIIDNLAGEMSSDYMIDKDAARNVMECIAELLGYAPPLSMAHIAAQEDGKESFTDDVVIKSPIVGTFYAASSPESEPCVKCGSRVKKDDVLFIIDSMKLMNEVTIEFDVVVSEIFVENGQSVEYGQPIMCINKIFATQSTQKVFTVVEAREYTGDRVEIPYGYTEIRDAFVFCKDIKSVKMPDSVKIVGDQAFCLCDGLTDVHIPDSVISIGKNAFANCVNLKSINIPNGVKSIGEGAFWCCTNITNIDIPDSVTSIGKHAFAHCDRLAVITISDNIISIGEEAFPKWTEVRIRTDSGIMLKETYDNTIDFGFEDYGDIFDSFFAK